MKGYSERRWIITGGAGQTLSGSIIPFFQLSLIRPTDTLKGKVLNRILKNLYDGAIQSDPGKKDGGYIRLEFIGETDISGENTDNSGKHKSRTAWKETVLERIPGIIELFQDHGYQASDLGIIVREGREGEAVVRKMIDYSNGCRLKNRLNIITILFRMIHFHCHLHMQ
jgi:hypothetical protein